MQMPRPTEADRERFHALVPDDPRVEVKPMFGNLGGFVNRNMFVGVFGSDLGVKLSDDDQERLRAAGGGPFGPPERPMGGWITLPASLSVDEQKSWVDRALAHVATLPPKEAKSRSRAPKKPGD